MDAFEVNKSAGAVLVGAAGDLRQQDVARHRLQGAQAGKAGLGPAHHRGAPTASQGAGGPFRRRQVVALLSKANRRVTARTLQELPAVYTPRERRAQHGRARTCGASLGAPGRARRLPLLRRHEEHGLAAGPARSWRPICTTRRPRSPATRWPLSASRIMPSWQTFSSTCASCPTARRRCRSSLGGSRVCTSFINAGNVGWRSQLPGNEQGLTWRSVSSPSYSDRSAAARLAGVSHSPGRCWPNGPQMQLRCRRLVCASRLGDPAASASDNLTKHHALSLIGEPKFGARLHALRLGEPQRAQGRQRAPVRRRHPSTP